MWLNGKNTHFIVMKIHQICKPSKMIAVTNSVSSICRSNVTSFIIPSPKVVFITSRWKICFVEVQISADGGTDDCTWLFAIHQITTNSSNRRIFCLPGMFEDQFYKRVIKRKCFKFRCFASFWFVQGIAYERAVDFFLICPFTECKKSNMNSCFPQL